jgi:hypothetical protein
MHDCLDTCRYLRDARMLPIHRLLNWNPATEASDESYAVSRGCAHASILLGVAAGVQGTLGAMFAFVRDWTSGRDAGLTELGRSLFRPERDLETRLQAYLDTAGNGAENKNRPLFTTGGRRG